MQIAGMIFQTRSRMKKPGRS
ncbi:hypothetical protein ACTQWB_05785 [Blautia sp. HCP3S3_H10_2]